MYKFLVVGCGGSGAKTVAYMMDQLKALLREVDSERTELPKAWQFVSIDSPVQPESGPEGLPNVTQAGGRYIGIGSTQPYATFDAAVTADLAAKKGLKEVATWATTHPENNTTPISDGAGQYRAIGRMLTIPSLRRIREGLNKALDTMNLSESITELNELNSKVSGHHSNVQGTQPVILVVTSMAGGSGASMFLDVCRVLSTLDKANPENTGVFVMTPEVFEDIPKEQMLGAWPNSLAMFGEVLATQTGAGTKSDRDLYAALGINGANRPSTFARLFTVGNRMGEEHAKFGDGGSMSVYRGLGRALSALMFSEKASESFKRYSLGNPGSPSFNRQYLGWSNPSKVALQNIPWGTLGFSQLNMGRDKYAEYAAQRLARASFDRLLHGHIDSRTDRSGEEQLKAKLEERLPNVLKQLLIREDFADKQPNMQEIEEWLGTVFYRQTAGAVDEAMTIFTSPKFLPVPSDGQNGSEWVSEIEATIRDSRNAQRLMKSIDNNAYAAVHQFANYLTDIFIGACEKELAEVGVPYLEALLFKLDNILDQKLSAGVKSYRQVRSNLNILQEPEEAAAVLTPLSGHGSIRNGQAIINGYAKCFRRQFEIVTLARIADNLGEVLDHFRIEVVDRLRDEVEKAHKDLNAASQKKVVTLNLASVATDHPNAWPAESDERIAERFRGAFNEILITEVDNFPRDYESHLLETVRSQSNDVRDASGATRLATRAVILGQWETTGSVKAPEDTLASKKSANSNTNRVGWVPMVLQKPPHGAGESRDVSSAVFALKIRPSDLLERARAWVERPDYAFEKFISTDLRSYLLPNQELPKAEYDLKVQRLRSAFRSALDLARPLAAVSKPMVQLVHKDTEVVNRYTFSEIPLDGLNAVDELLSVLSSASGIDSQTVDVFKDALTDSDRVRRIDIFGSYPNYSPIVFSSLLPHIAHDWALRSSKTSFWRDRRTRPLAAALPLSDDERFALVAGWILGRALGRVYIKNEDQPDASVYVYDAAEGRWHPFPTPLLTDRSLMRHEIDWMPVVIESILLAVADSHRKDDYQALGGSLKPYQVLRGIFDDGLEGPTNVESGVRHPALDGIAHFLLTGKKPAQSEPEGFTIEDRMEYLEDCLLRVEKAASRFIDDEDIFSPMNGGKPKVWANPPSRKYASKMPYYRDLAPDAKMAVEQLRELLLEAKELAEHPQDEEPNLNDPGSISSHPDNQDVEFCLDDDDDLSGI